MKRIRAIHGVHAGKTGRVIGPDYRPRGTDQVWTPVQFDGEDRPMFMERGALEPVGGESRKLLCEGSPR